MDRCLVTICAFLLLPVQGGQGGGRYAPLNKPAAGFSAADVLYGNDFSDAASLAEDFTVLDFQGTEAGPSGWSIADGVLHQSSNIYGPVTAGTGIPYEKGTFLLSNDSLAGDWELQVRFQASDNDGVGIVFNYTDTAHFNWIEWDAQHDMLAFCRSGPQVNTGIIVASESSDNPYVNTGYVKPTNWEHAQGLASDGTYYYYAGHHDDNTANPWADIHKIRISDNEEVAVFASAGPLHSAEVDLNESRGTLLVCSGGNGRLPYVWELDTADGTKLNAWDFAGTGFNGGALVAWTGNDDIILFTSASDGAEIAFTQATLQADSMRTIGKTWSYTASDLGVPQGLDYKDGYLYYLADAGPNVSSNPHYIYKISLDSAGSGIIVIEKYLIIISVETEGLDISSDDLVSFGTAEETIFSFNESLPDLNPDPFGYVPGNWYTLRVAKESDRYQVFIDDVLRMSVTDSSFLSGKAGLMSRGSENLQFDDFTISVPAVSVGPGENRRRDTPVSSAEGLRVAVARSGSAQTLAISFTVPSGNYGSLSITDVSGRILAEPGGGVYRSGTHRVYFSSHLLQTGAYICRLTGRGYSLQRLFSMR